MRGTGMEYVIKKPVYSGKRVKEYGLIIRLPEEQCSDEERDFIRARYIAKLLEWKRAELAKNK